MVSVRLEQDEIRAVAEWYEKNQEILGTDVVAIEISNFDDQIVIRENTGD